MLTFFRRHKILAWMLGLLTACTVVIAASELSGQANKTCADAGLNGAKLELASLDTIAQSTSKPVDWQQERKLRKNIDAIDAKYEKLVAKAQAEIDSTGVVSDSTKKNGLDCASKFQKASETYAQFWDKNNGKTRAKLAREAGVARVKNADMTFNTIDQDKIDAYNSQMEKLKMARQEYLAEAKTDVSDADRAKIKANLTPRINSMMSQAQGLINTITSLLSNIKDQVGDMGIGGLVSCASNTATSDNPAAALLAPVSNLLDMVKQFISNLEDFASDVNSL